LFVIFAFDAGACELDMSVPMTRRIAGATLISIDVDNNLNSSIDIIYLSQRCSAHHASAFDHDMTLAKL
jgi:hypothetical protein